MGQTPSDPLMVMATFADTKKPFFGLFSHFPAPLTHNFKSPVQPGVYAGDTSEIQPDFLAGVPCLDGACRGEEALYIYL